jgi:hypothetical protein
MSASGFRWSELRARLRSMRHGLVAVLAVACSADPPSDPAQAPTTLCDYGSVYPNASVIDPDNPVYQDGSWTQQEVIDNFEQAKLLGKDAYPAYRAARDHAQYMECAYCKCGCGGPALGHESAIDCFKDMHGFA